MKKRFTVFMIFCLSVAGCSSSIEVVAMSTANSSISKTATPLPAGDLGFGEIHGKITDSLTGTPIEGAVITCEHHSFTSPATCSGTATTDANGMYKFENVYFHDTDTIKVTVQATGYQTQEFTNGFFKMADLEMDVMLNAVP